jgi:hypothetical protein
MHGQMITIPGGIPGEPDTIILDTKNATKDLDGLQLQLKKFDSPKGKTEFFMKLDGAKSPEAPAAPAPALSPEAPVAPQP